MYPFERFTEDAKKVLTLAREEADGGHRRYIGTEHLLLGIIRGPDPARRRSLRWRSGSKRCGSPSIGSLAERTSRPSTRPFPHRAVTALANPPEEVVRSRRFVAGTRSELAALVDKRRYDKAAGLQVGERDLLKRLAEAEQKWLDGLQPS